jgi:hypothetical protein
MIVFLVFVDVAVREDSFVGRFCIEIRCSNDHIDKIYFVFIESLDINTEQISQCFPKKTIILMETFTFTKFPCFATHVLKIVFLMTYSCLDEINVKNTYL